MIVRLRMRWGDARWRWRHRHCLVLLKLRPAQASLYLGRQPEAIDRACSAHAEQVLTDIWEWQKRRPPLLKPKTSREW